jgi:membrane protein implicated in regulation of membrane protease activity
MKKILPLTLLVLVLSGTVLAVLALLHRLSWTYALIAFGAGAILATVELGWQFYRFWRSLPENDKTVRNSRQL